MSEAPYPGLSKLLISFMETQIASLPYQAPKKVLTSQVIERAELPLFSETFVKCPLVFDLGVSLWRGKEGFCDLGSKPPPTECSTMGERGQWLGKW